MAAFSARTFFSARALIGALALVFLGPLPVAAAGPDLLPPEIYAIFPEDGSTIETDRPTLGVRFADSGSGIRAESMMLVLDGLDVTARAELRELPGGPFEVVYTPPSPLGDGLHRVSFRISDRAGNPTRIEWTFNIHTGLLARTSLGGTSSTVFSVWPLTRLSEAMDLHLDIRLPDGFTLSGHMRALWTGPLMMAGADLGLGTFQIPEYAVAMQNQSFHAAVGAIEVALPSNTLFPPVARSGVSAVYSRSLVGGGHGAFSAFAGQAYRSSGFHLSQFDFAGAAFSAGGENGAGIAAFAIQTRDNDELGWLGGCGIKFPIGDSGSFFAEGLWTLDSEASGYAGGAGVILRGSKSFLDFRIFTRNDLFETPWMTEGFVGNSQTRVTASGFMALEVPVVFTFNLAASVSPASDPFLDETVTANAVIEGRFAADHAHTWTVRYQGDYSEQPMYPALSHTLGISVTGSAVPEAGWKLGCTFTPTGHAINGYLVEASVFQKLGPVRIFLWTERARELRSGETAENVSCYGVLLSPWAGMGAGCAKAELGLDLVARDRFNVDSGETAGQSFSFSLSAKSMVALWQNVSLLGNAKLVLSGTGPDLLFSTEFRWVF